MTTDPIEELSGAARQEKRLYRSQRDEVIGGVAGGLGEYFAVDPVWSRIGFVILAVGGGSGILIYLIMWIIVPEAPDDYSPATGTRGELPGAVVIGGVFVFVGTIALINTLAPDLGRYFWPLVLVLGGLGLVVGGLNRDRS